MDIKVNALVQANFICRAVKEDGTVRKETDRFFNTVTDIGLARMGTISGASDWGTYCFVGSGNTPPTFADTTVQAFVAQTTTVQTSVDSSNKTTAPYYAALTKTFRFPLGAAAGNLTEIGIGWLTGVNPNYVRNCWNRALIKDAGGNPTTLVILSDEFLDVTVEFRVYPQTSVSGSFSFKDKLGAVISTHTYDGTPCISNTGDIFNAWQFANLELRKNVTTLDPLPTLVMTGSNVATLYAGTTTQLTTTSLRTAVLAALNTANDTFNGFKVMYNNILGAASLGYKFKFTPAITKVNTQEFTFRLDVSWGRYP